MTRFCDVPGRQTVGGTKNPDLDAIVALAPDLVVVNDEENRAEDAAALDGRRSRAALDVAPLGRGRRPEVRALAARVGAAVPAPFGADEWDDWLASMLTPRWWDAFVAVWRRPWMSLAHRHVRRVAARPARCRQRVRRFARPLPEVTLDEVAARAPSVVLLPSEPYAFAPRHVREVQDAVPGVPVALVDGRDLFWWGIRTPRPRRACARCSLRR